MTTPGITQGSGAPSGDPQGEAITQLFHPEIATRFRDDSEDRASRRRIEEAEAQSLRAIKTSLVNATIAIAIGVSALGGIITFWHQDAKTRELGVAVISAPIAGLFGVLAGMGLK